MLTKVLVLLSAITVTMGSAFALPSVSCSLFKTDDYSVSGQMPLYNGAPFKFDLVAETLDEDLIEGRVEAKQTVRYGDLVPFRTTIYINLFEVIARDQFILVIPFGRSYFQTIRFEGHTLRCRVI